jgi:hypothetical protein
MTRFRHRWTVAAALWVGAAGVCPGIVGRMEVGEAEYEALAAQEAFGGLVHVKAGGG